MQIERSMHDNSPTVATLDVSQQTKDSVTQTTTDSNTASARCGTPCPTTPKQEILPPDTSTAIVPKEVLPPLKPTTITLETLCKVAQSEVDAMSFKELDGFIDLGIHMYCAQPSQHSAGTASHEASTHPHPRHAVQSWNPQRPQRCPGHHLDNVLPQQKDAGM